MMRSLSLESHYVKEKGQKRDQWRLNATSIQGGRCESNSRLPSTQTCSTIGQSRTENGDHPNGIYVVLQHSPGWPRTFDSFFAWASGVLQLWAFITVNNFIKMKPTYAYTEYQHSTWNFLRSSQGLSLGVSDIIGRCLSFWYKHLWSLHTCLMCMNLFCASKLVQIQRASQVGLQSRVSTN